MPEKFALEKKKLSVQSNTIRTTPIVMVDTCPQTYILQATVNLEDGALPSGWDLHQLTGHPHTPQLHELDADSTFGDVDAHNAAHNCFCSHQNEYLPPSTRTWKTVLPMQLKTYFAAPQEMRTNQWSASDAETVSACQHICKLFAACKLFTAPKKTNCRFTCLPEQHQRNEKNILLTHLHCVGVAEKDRQRDGFMATISTSMCTRHHGRIMIFLYKIASLLNPQQKQQASLANKG